MVSIIHFQSSACSNMSLGLTNIIQQPWLWTHFYSPVGKHTNKQKNLFEHRCIIITTRIMYCIQQLQQLAPLAPLNKFSVHSWLFIQFYIQFQILFCSFNSVVGFGHDCSALLFTLSLLFMFECGCKPISGLPLGISPTCISRSVQWLAMEWGLISLSLSVSLSIYSSFSS